MSRRPAGACGAAWPRELTDETAAFSGRQRSPAEVPRHLPAGRPGRTAGAHPLRTGRSTTSSWCAPAFPVARSRDAVAGHGPSGRRRRRRHPPADLARRRPVPLRPQGGSGAAHPQPRRAPRHHAGRLRRRRAQHRGLPGTAGRQSPEGPARSRPAPGRAVPPDAPAPTTRSGSTASRAVSAEPRRRPASPSRRWNRSTAPRTSLASSRSAWPGPATTAPTSSATTSASSRSPAPTEPTASQCSSVAGSAPPTPGPTTPSRVWPIRSAGSRPTTSRTSPRRSSSPIRDLGRPGGSQAGAAQVRARGHRGSTPSAARSRPASALAWPLRPSCRRGRPHDHLGWHRQDDGRWFLGVPVPSGRVTGSVPCRAGRDGRAAPDRPADHPSPGPAAHRHRRRRAHGRGRRCLPSSRRGAGRRPHARPPPGHGLPGPPHLWAGLGRGGTGRAGGAERARGRAGRRGLVRARPARADDRMSQRLRPSVHGGDRHRRADQDRVRRPPRRRSGRRSARPAVAREASSWPTSPAFSARGWTASPPSGRPAKSFGDFVHRTESLA